MNPPSRRVDPHLVFGISLLAALALSWPALSGAMHDRVDIVQAGVHLLVAMAISWAGCYALGSMLYGFAQSSPAPAPAPTGQSEDTPQRRATDAAANAITTAGAITQGTEGFDAIEAA